MLGVVGRLLVLMLDACSRDLEALIPGKAVNEAVDAGTGLGPKGDAVVDDGRKEEPQLDFGGGDRTRRIGLNTGQPYGQCDLLQVFGSQWSRSSQRCADRMADSAAGSSRIAIPIPGPK